MRKALLAIYRKLFRHFGPRHWWPGEGAFEVMVGAILTQNTAWPNVEKAINNLKKEKALSPKKLETIKLKKLRRLIKPSGYYNEKAKKLKNLTAFLRRSCGFEIKKLKRKKLKELRRSLLGVNGIGPETADSILLYALEKPVFVVDAYTRRIFSRLGLIGENAGYAEIQSFFTDNLPKKTKLFNEYHALIVELGKTYCRKGRAICGKCPLKLGKKRGNMV